MSRRYDTVIFDLDGNTVKYAGGSGRWCQCGAEAFWKTGSGH